MNRPPQKPYELFTVPGSSPPHKAATGGRGGANGILPVRGKRYPWFLNLRRRSHGKYGGGRGFGGDGRRDELLVLRTPVQEPVLPAFHNAPAADSRISRKALAFRFIAP